MAKLRIVQPKPIANAEKRRWLDDVIKKLENAPSCVDTDGMWTYDRVPSAVVIDTLDLLHDLKDYLMRDKAVEEWCSTHSLSEGWEPIKGWYYKRQPMVLIHNPDDPYPWCVQYRGNGHYYQRLDQAYEWVIQRMTGKAVVTENLGEAVVLEKGELRTFDGFMYLEDLDWMVWCALLTGENTEDYVFRVWRVGLKKSKENCHSLHGLPKKSYGETWRCWSAQPTDEQMEAEPWK